MLSAEPSTNIAASAKNRSQWVVCRYLVTNLSVASSLPNTSDKLITFVVATLQCKRRLVQSKRRYKELDDLVKKLYEANATGKLSDRHFERLLAEYDNEQSVLETAMTELQEQIDTWSEDKLKTDRFIDLVKRYTDFSELTTAMLNEFVEKVVVHEGDKRGNDRCQRVDIHMNFIGTFEVPADIITPMELAEQRRQQEEQAAKEKRLKESEQARYEQRKADKREFTARKKGGAAHARRNQSGRTRQGKTARMAKRMAG